MSRRNIHHIDHFLSIDDLEEDMIISLIHRALAYKNGTSYHFLEPKFVSNLFFEDSTRTHYSFEMAEHRLGVKVLSFDPQTSNLSKGESLYDTVLTMSSLGVDAVIIRANEEKYYDKLISSPTIKCAIINAGDGLGQHPSQSMMDLMTIYEHFGHFNGLKIGILGDLAHSRVANSNIKALSKMGATLYFAGPSEWQLEKDAHCGEHIDVDKLVETVDVLMLLRVQKEHHPMHLSDQEYFEKYGLTIARAKKLKANSIIMHPGPVNRNVEIADELVEAQNSKIATQINNGVYMRMAILEAILT